MKRILTFILFLTFVISLYGCAYIAPRDEAIVVTDDMGREINLPNAPVRIVSLAPSNTEFLFALGLDEKIAGITDLCNYPTEVAQKEKVGGFSDPSVEKIIALKPDLVVAASLHEAVVKQLDQLNIPVIVLNAQNIQQILANVEMLGKVTGADRAAEELINRINADLKLVDDKIQNLSADEMPLVYFEVWNDPIMTAGPYTFIDELITRAGGVNIAADAPVDYPVYTLEELLARKPEVMLYTHGVETAEQIMDRANWDNMPALENGRVYIVNEDLVMRPGPRIVEGLIAISQKLHPDLWK
jgi:iron complex transport system substrate-binding protein